MTAYGTLYIISAPSGGGKTSLVNALLPLHSELEVSISHTTRTQRPGETDGVNYYFVSEAGFQELIAQNAFLEYAHVFGHFYGTSRQWVEDKLAAGIDVILEIDWQGAKQIRSMLPQTMSIFILPPSWQVLERRLRERAQDSEAVIKRRLVEAKNEISHYLEYDYLVVNDDFSIALSELRSIIQARRLNCSVQSIKHAQLLQNLLEST